MDASKISKSQADALDISKQPEKTAVPKPMQNHPATLVKDKIAFTAFAVEDDPKSTCLEAVYYLPLIYRKILPKVVSPLAKAEQREKFQKEAEIVLNKKVKRILKKVK